MDKILLAIFFSALAGFITAVLSIVKLVNEKENKTSEFRQMWTNSIRATISDLAAKLGAVTHSIEYQIRLMGIEAKLSKRQTTSITEKRLDHIRATLLNVRENVDSYRHDLYRSYSLCRLHFKPDDPDFGPIENSFNKIRANNRELSMSKDDEERKEIVRTSIGYTDEIVDAGRTILKKEWERVKEGERAYQNTKKYSFYGGIFMLAALLIIGGSAVFFASKVADVSNAPSNLSCWTLQSPGEKLFKFNSCTGQLIEVRQPPPKTIGQAGEKPHDPVAVATTTRQNVNK